jgi:dTMP kinase
MKLTVLAVSILNGLFALLSPQSAAAFVLAILALYVVYGIMRSVGKQLDPLNDVPNALRVSFAAMAPLLALAIPLPFGIALAVLSFAAALMLNDEYQRRTFDSIRKRRAGGSVALLGIDGSGKSTHAAELEEWFRGRGYYCTLVPFHRYLFVDKLGRRKRAGNPSALGQRGNPLRPLLSVLDNIILYVITSFGRGLEGRIVLYDRYIWSTYVKYEALRYPVRPLRWLYTLPRPRYAVILDITVDKSLAVIQSRPAHIRYQHQVLGDERDEYIKIAKKTGFPLVDASRASGIVQGEIERKLASVFPIVGGE